MGLAQVCCSCRLACCCTAVKGSAVKFGVDMQVTLASLHQMFDSAKDIMTWLSECARVVAKGDHAVQWTTPLGLPVVQPYRKKVHLTLHCTS